MDGGYLGLPLSDFGGRLGFVLVTKEAFGLGSERSSVVLSVLPLSGDCCCLTTLVGRQGWLVEGIIRRVFVAGLIADRS